MVLFGPYSARRGWHGSGMETVAHSSLRNNRKFKLLCRQLSGHWRATIAGCLDFLWQAAHEDRTVVGDGMLKGWTEEHIEAAAEWEGERGLFVKSAVSVGFLVYDGSTYGIHDYADWAPKYVKERWKRLPSYAPIRAQHERISDYAPPTQHNTTQHQHKEPKISSSTPVDGVCESIYQAYPRRVGRRAALQAIGKAIARLNGKQADPGQWLAGRVAAYAKAVDGKDKQYIPHPSTWFGQERYMDDEADWSAWRTSDRQNDPSKVRKADVSIYEQRTIRTVDDLERRRANANQRTGKPEDSGGLLPGGSVAV